MVSEMCIFGDMCFTVCSAVPLQCTLFVPIVAVHVQSKSVAFVFCALCPSRHPFKMEYGSEDMTVIRRMDYYTERGRNWKNVEKKFLNRSRKHATDALMRLAEDATYVPEENILRKKNDVRTKDGVVLWSFLTVTEFHLSPFDTAPCGDVPRGVPYAKLSVYGEKKIPEPQRRQHLYDEYISFG